eukprot:9503939-Pyramimonas_sp.AAC.1
MLPPSGPEYVKCSAKTCVVISVLVDMGQADIANESSVFEKAQPSIREASARFHLFWEALDVSSEGPIFAKGNRPPKNRRMR